MKFLLLLALLPATLIAQTSFSDTAAKINAILRPWSNPNLPGVSIAISRNGDLIYAQASGSADLEHGVPNDTTTIFEAGSVSKQFTAAAILLLQKDGKLNVQDDVRKYIPELPNYGDVITIFDLIHHQSGIRDWGSVAEVEGWGRGSRAHTNEHALQIICRQTALNNPPGTEYIYSNSNYNLMAIIVERVAKTTFAQFCKERIFIPAGMTHTSWRNDYRQIVKNRAIAYQQTPMLLKTSMPFENAHGNGGLLTTPADLVKWASFMHAGKLGGPSTLQHQLEKGIFRNGTRHNYAAGLNIGCFNGQDLVTHSGATAGYRANLDYFPKQGLSIAILSNTSSFSPVNIGQKIAALFFPAPPAISYPASVPYKANPATIQQLQGWYRDTRSDEAVLLQASDSTLVFPGKTPLYQFPDGSTYTEGYRIQFAPAKQAPSFRRISFDASADTVLFLKESSSINSAAYFDAFKGSYFSDEANTTVQLNIRDSLLQYIHEPELMVEYKATYKDGFAIPGTAIRFKRNSTGKVEGFHISVGRARRIWFQKNQNLSAQDDSIISNPLDVQFGDPFILKTSGRYFMYGTGNGAKNGFVAYSSTDLKTWKREGQVYHGNNKNGWGLHSYWAPEVYERNGKYYMFYSAHWKNNPTNELENFKIGVAVSDKPTGPFTDIRNTPIFDPGYPIIDANVLFAENGKVYLYYSRCCYKNPVKSEVADWAKEKGWFNEIEESWVYGVEMKADFSGVVGEPVLLLRPPVKMDDPQAAWESLSVTSQEVNRRWTEGSFIFKQGETYYMMYSANYFGGKNYAVGYATSRSPLGPFVKAANNPVLQKNTATGGIVTGTGHNSVTLSPDGKTMLCVYHGRTNKTGNERVVFIDKMVITKDGVLKVEGPTTSTNLP